MEYDEDDEGRVTWIIRVEEDMTTAYGPLIRYDRRHKYYLGVWLEENNLRGKGEVLKIGLAGLYTQQATASWNRPWLFNVEGLEATVSALGQHADFVFRPTRYRQYHGDLELKWKFRAPFYAKAGVNFGQDDYRDSYQWPLPDRGEGSGPDATFDPVKQTRTAWSAVLGVDTRSNPWYPSRGVMIETGARHWSSSDFDSYTETHLDARFFIPVPVGKHILALRGFGRRVDGPAHLDNVLFFGGPETIRGYRFGGLEGDEGYLLSVEYRIPLFIMPISPRGEMIGLGLHAFGDAGDAWYEGADPGRALQSFGAGMHLNLDTLQLRFEAAKPRDGDWRFEFMDVFNF
jgi:outer membrane protein assembly factor BamA